jgi:outer membrane protein assembly factor BamB
LWTTDVRGWAWGQPALLDSRLFVGTVSSKGYLVDHQGGVLALDRATGRLLWHFDATPAEGSYGFLGSPAVDDGKVFASSLDGRLYAFSP